MKYDEDGKELPDRTPVEIPIRFNRPPSMQEMMKQYIRTEMSRQASEEGEESFEEADDFEVDEEQGMPFSPHELTPMQEEFRMEPPNVKEVGSGKESGVESPGVADSSAKSDKLSGDVGKAGGESVAGGSEGRSKSDVKGG